MYFRSGILTHACILMRFKTQKEFETAKEREDKYRHSGSFKTDHFKKTHLYIVLLLVICFITREISHVRCYHFSCPHLHISRWGT